MSDKRFCFIILHYASVQDTVNCIESILKLEGSRRADIIVVDNGCALKTENLPKSGNIQLIPLAGNEGFSAANNKGYQYALARCRPDFCIAANNDIVFEQTDFLEKIEQEYEKSRFYVLGPDIIVPGLNWHQSPLALDCMNREQAAARVNKLAFYKKHSILHFLQERAFMWTHNILCRTGLLLKVKKTIGRGKLPIYTERYENPGLMGACLIFSERYMEQNDRLFYPETFLYFEEDILTFNCKKNHWKMVYSPELFVHHNDSAATKKSSAGAFDRDRRTVRRMYDAALVYYNYLLEDGGKFPE